MNRSTRNSAALELTGEGLTLDDAERVLQGQVAQLKLAPAARKRALQSRHCLESLLANGATIYGVNTGFGKLSNQRIADSEILTLQENLLRSHAVGMGNLLTISEVRLVLTLRIQALAKGFSGVTPELLDTLIELYNRGVVPAIPEQGSVGASGDLAPLAHLALVVIGEGQAFLAQRGARSAERTARSAERRAQGSERSPDSASRSALRAPRSALHAPRLHSGRAALKRVRLAPYRLQAKEGLSLINGTQVSTALLAEALVHARHLARIADVAGAMTVEATKSSQKPFDPRVQQIRPHPGQMACAANLRRLLEESEIMVSHADCDKVQDAYSIRCMPQVHGTLRGALAHVTRVVECEMNAATDNPLVFADTNEIISGGNFHGQPIALAADLLATALTDLSSICERRVENLVNPDLSGLPGFLTPRPGLNSGMMLVQVLAAALVSENKTLAFPASVDSIPTSANREDHVPMSTAAARKCRTVVTNARRVLACELLCAAQGLEFHKPLRPGRGVEAAYDCLREHVRPLDHDRILQRDLEAVEGLIESGGLLAAVERTCGSFE